MATVDKTKMTRDERAIRACDEVAKNIKNEAEKGGQPVSYDEARRKAARIAELAERQKRGG
jgi:hypothetical protein